MFPERKNCLLKKNHSPKTESVQAEEKVHRYGHEHVLQTRGGGGLIEYESGLGRPLVRKGHRGKGECPSEENA